MASLGNAGLEPTDDGIETISTRVGVPLQRKAIPDVQPPAPGFPRARTKPLSTIPMGSYERADIANQTIARTHAARLSQAFIGAFAPVRRLVLDSEGPEDLIAKIEHFYGDSYPPEQLAPVILEALAAQAANGAVRDAA